MSKTGFQFDFSDPKFGQWLFSALKQEGALMEQDSGGYKANLAGVSAASSDNILGDRFLSLPQREYLLRSLKAGSITFDANGKLQSSPPLKKGGRGDFPLSAKVDRFFECIKRSAVQGKTSRWGEVSDWVATRVRDTGTDEEGLEDLLRSLSPDEMPRFKELVARHFAAQGKSLEELLTEEVSSRELGRMLGIVRTAQKDFSKKGGNDSFVKAQRALATVEEMKGYVEAYSMRSHGLMGNVIEDLRQNQLPRAYLKALHTLQDNLADAKRAVQRGKTPDLKALDASSAAVLREVDVFRMQEAEGNNALDTALEASTNASKTVAISSAAILTGGYAAAAAPAVLGVGLLAGGTAGTVMGVALNAEEKIVRGGSATDDLGNTLKDSATEGFSGALSLGIGGTVAKIGMKSGSKVLQHEVTKQVIINESIAAANTGLRGDMDNYGMADIAISGVSGAIGGGIIDKHLKGAANLTAEMAREAGENLAETQWEQGNITTADAIGGIAGALSELGGSVGKNHAKGSTPNHNKAIPHAAKNFLDAQEAYRKNRTDRNRRAILKAMETFHRLNLEAARQKRDEVEQKNAQGLFGVAYAYELARTRAEEAIRKFEYYLRNIDPAQNSRGSSGGTASVNGPGGLFIDGAFGTVADPASRGLPVPPGQRGTYVTNGYDGMTGAPLGPFEKAFDVGHPMIDPAKSPKPDVIAGLSSTQVTMHFCDPEGKHVAELILNLREMKGEKVLEIESISIDPSRKELEGQGIATSIAASTLQWAGKAGVRAVTLVAVGDGVHFWMKKRFAFQPGIFSDGKVSTSGMIGVRMEGKRPSENVGRELESLWAEWLATPEGEPYRSEEREYPKTFLDWIYHLTLVRDLRANPVTDAEIAALQDNAARKSNPQPVTEISPVTTAKIQDSLGRRVGADMVFALAEHEAAQDLEDLGITEMESAPVFPDAEAASRSAIPALDRLRNEIARELDLLEKMNLPPDSDAIERALLEDQRDMADFCERLQKANPEKFAELIEWAVREGSEHHIEGALIGPDLSDLPHVITLVHLMIEMAGPQALEGVPIRELAGAVRQWLERVERLNTEDEQQLKEWTARGSQSVSAETEKRRKKLLALGGKPEIVDMMLRYDPRADLPALKKRVAQGRFDAELCRRILDLIGKGSTSGSSGGANGVSGLGSALADGPPLEGAAARMAAEPPTPLQRRGLFAANGDVGQVPGSMAGRKNRAADLLKNQTFLTACLKNEKVRDKIHGKAEIFIREDPKTGEIGFVVADKKWVSRSSVQEWGESDSQFFLEVNEFEGLRSKDGQKFRRPLFYGTLKDLGPEILAINEVGINPEFQGRGIYENYYAEIEKEAARKGYKFLSANSSNHRVALTFFRKGFYAVNELRPEYQEQFKAVVDTDQDSEATFHNTVRFLNDADRDRMVRPEILSQSDYERFKQQVQIFDHAQAQALAGAQRPRMSLQEVVEKHLAREKPVPGAQSTWTPPAEPGAIFVEAIVRDILAEATKEGLQVTPERARELAQKSFELQHTSLDAIPYAMAQLRHIGRAISIEQAKAILEKALHDSSVGLSRNWGGCFANAPKLAALFRLAGAETQIVVSDKHGHLWLRVAIQDGSGPKKWHIVDLVGGSESDSKPTDADYVFADLKPEDQLIGEKPLYAEGDANPRFEGTEKFLKAIDQYRAGELSWEELKQAGTLPSGITSEQDLVRMGIKTNEPSSSKQPPPPFHGTASHLPKTRRPTNREVWSQLLREAVDEVTLKRKNYAKLDQVPEREVKLDPDEEALEAAYQAWVAYPSQIHRADLQEKLVTYHQKQHQRFQECLEGDSLRKIVALLEKVETGNESHSDGEILRPGIMRELQFIDERLKRLEEMYDTKQPVPHPQAGRIGKPAPIEEAPETPSGTKQAPSLLQKVDPALLPPLEAALAKLEKADPDIVHFLETLSGMDLVTLVRVIGEGMPVPTLVVLNTGAVPQQMLNFLNGKSTDSGRFPAHLLSARRYASYLPTSLEGFAVGRLEPNLTLEVSVSPADLICWWADHFERGVIKKEGNFISVSSADSRIFSDFIRSRMRLIAIGGVEEKPFWKELTRFASESGIPIVFVEGKNFQEVVADDQARRVDNVKTAAAQWARSVIGPLQEEIVTQAEWAQRRAREGAPFAGWLKESGLDSWYAGLREETRDSVDLFYDSAPPVLKGDMATAFEWALGEALASAKPVNPKDIEFFDPARANDRKHLEGLLAHVQDLEKLIRHVENSPYANFVNRPLPNEGADSLRERVSVLKTWLNSQLAKPQATALLSEDFTAGDLLRGRPVFVNKVALTSAEAKTAAALHKRALYYFESGARKKAREDLENLLFKEVAEAELEGTIEKRREEALGELAADSFDAVLDRTGFLVADALIRKDQDAIESLLDHPNPVVTASVFYWFRTLARNYFRLY
ncbi:MAG: hypothetical protein Q7T11_02095, partial [Deltaproteobacteria bacterium]|nr:hypothetical protein [Deltaproteobacteria bacterium]